MQINKLLESILDNAKDKKYSEFEDAVKQELKNKLSNHPEIKKYSDDYEKIQSMKDLFKQISKEPEPEPTGKEEEDKIDDKINDEDDKNKAPENGEGEE